MSDPEADRIELERLREERRAVDEIISDGQMTAHRIRRLHNIDGFGNEQHCVLCVQHGEQEWPCLTVKALDPWRWTTEGANRYE